MAGDGAQVAALALLREGDDQLRRLAGLDQRRLLAMDAEVVQDVADVLEDERDFPGPRDRLRREPEEELAALDLDRRCRRGGRSLALRGGELDERERGDRDHN